MPSAVSAAGRPIRTKGSLAAAIWKTTAPGGASPENGEGYDGQCGGCADQTYTADEASTAHQAETTELGGSSAPEPERLHANMVDGPIITSPSGQHGFYSPVGGSEKAAGIAKYGPVVQVAQLVNDGKAWNPTPARFCASSAVSIQPGSRLAIDMGSDWALSAEDTQALEPYRQSKLDEAAVSE